MRFLQLFWKTDMRYSHLKNGSFVHQTAAIKAFERQIPLYSTLFFSVGSFHLKPEENEIV